MLLIDVIAKRAHYILFRGRKEQMLNRLETFRIFVECLRVYIETFGDFTRCLRIYIETFGDFVLFCQV